VLDEQKSPAGFQHAADLGKHPRDIVHRAQNERAEDLIHRGVIEWEGLCGAPEDRQLEAVFVGGVLEMRMEVDVGLDGEPSRSGWEVGRIRPGPSADLEDYKLATVHRQRGEQARLAFAVEPLLGRVRAAQAPRKQTSPETTPDPGSDPRRRTFAGSVRSLLFSHQIPLLLMAIAKIIEVSAVSKVSFDDAVKNAYTEVSQSVRNVKSVYVEDFIYEPGDGDGNFRVHCKVTFLIDNGDVG